MNYKKHIASVLALLSLGVAFFSAQSLTALPEGNNGIAARYPGDSAIQSDSNVIYADGFENYRSGSDLGTNWNGGVYHNALIDTTKKNIFAGNKSLEFWAPQQSAELSNGIARELKKSDELDVLFLRYYAKFDESFNITGSSHNGGGMSAHYFVNGNATPGVPADGKNKFLIEYEFWRGEASDPTPGNLNIYIYHPEQRSQWGDHFFPNGDVMPNTSIPGNFGTDFISRPNIVVDLGKWYCYEVMLKANTPGLRDGRIGCWLDGKLVADFTNLRFRDVDSLKINRFGLSLHFGNNSLNQTWKWYDNVVAAKSYIGPMSNASTSVRHNKNLACKFLNSNLKVTGKCVVFTLSDFSNVVIDIYSLQGKLTGKLIDKTCGPGVHSVNWDGKDLSGKIVSGGTYIMRIRIGENTLSRTMVF